MKLRDWAKEKGVSYQKAYYAYTKGRLKGITKNGTTLEVDITKASVEDLKQKATPGRPFGRSHQEPLTRTASEDPHVVLEQSNFKALLDDHLEFLEEVAERKYHCLSNEMLEAEYSFGTLDLEPHCERCPFNASNLQSLSGSCAAPGIRVQSSMELVLSSSAVEQVRDLAATRALPALVSLLDDTTAISGEHRKEIRNKALTIFLTTIHNNLHLRKLNASNATLAQEIANLKTEVLELPHLRQELADLRDSYEDLKIAADQQLAASGEGTLEALESTWCTPVDTPIALTVSTSESLQPSWATSGVLSKMVGTHNTSFHSRAILIGTGLTSTRDLQLLVGDAKNTYEVSLTETEYAFLTTLLEKAKPHIGDLDED